MANQEQQTAAVPFNRITLTPVQEQYLDSLDGLKLCNQEGAVLAHVSLDELANPTPNAVVLDARTDALQIIQFLDSVIVRDGEVLELMPECQQGLRSILYKTQELLSVPAH